MTVRDIFQTYGVAYLNKYTDTIPDNHRKVIHDIMDCRTERMGTILCSCNSCGYSFEIYKSCGNRHCPTCQGEKANDWLSKRLDQMLPVHHFMITFTVPAPFREFFRSHQSFAYSNLFNSSSFVLKKLASEKTYFDGDIPGFFGVLHTWGRQIQYHPHIHYIVPGGAFSSLDHSWHSSNKSFYLPVRIMSKLVKSFFYKKMKKESFLHLIPDNTWEQDWNVNSQAVGNGARSVQYLANYVFRTAISDQRVLTVENDKVLFKYLDTRTEKEKTTRLHVFEFIRRFLQHVLPKGFMKIRYFGFIHPSSKIPLKTAVILLEAFYGFKAVNNEFYKRKSKTHRCPYCKKEHTIRYIHFTSSIKVSISGFT